MPGDQTPRPEPPTLIEGADGEYLAVLADDRLQAVEKVRAEYGYEADQVEPVRVKLTPLAGHPNGDVWWVESVTAAELEAADMEHDDGSEVELTVLGSPVDYWRLRDGV